MCPELQVRRVSGAVKGWRPQGWSGRTGRLQSCNQGTGGVREGGGGASDCRHVIGQDTCTGRQLTSVAVPTFFFFSESSLFFVSLFFFLFIFFCLFYFFSSSFSLYFYSSSLFFSFFFFIFCCSSPVSGILPPL